MKKTIFLVAALLLAAVFMSGCITAPASDDPIVGIWENPEPVTIPDGEVFDSSYYVFNADGTGYSLAEFAGKYVFGKLDFTWKNTGNGKYVAEFADVKNTGMPAVREIVLADGKLTHDIGENTFVPCSAADYVPGLWSGLADYKGHVNTQALIYFNEDGTGEMVAFTAGVETREDVYTISFTWKAEGDTVIMTGEKGVSSKLPIVNGELVYDGEYMLHKYTVEDHLYGLWRSDEPTLYEGVAYDVAEIIRSDGTGVELWYLPESDEARGAFTFTWKMIDSTTFEAVFDDGEVWQFEMIGLQLYDSETWYNKIGEAVIREYALNKGA